MNFEVLSCTKFEIFRRSAPDPAEGAYSAPPDPLAGGEGARCPLKNPTTERAFGQQAFGPLASALRAEAKCPSP